MEYNLQYNIGKAKYVVNFHNGIKKHKDGSKFFDIKIFSNKKDRDIFIDSLIQQGYTETLNDDDIEIMKEDLSKNDPFGFANAINYEVFKDPEKMKKLNEIFSKLDKS